MRGQSKNSDRFGGNAFSRARLGGCALFKGRWVVTARDKYGNFKWEDFIENDVVNAGLDDILDKYFKGSAYTAAHYVGLTDGTPTVAPGDTMASHAGWVEVVAYDESVREDFTPGTVTSQSVDNSAAKAQFTISANGTVIGGAFVCDDDTRGGSTGILYAAGAFTAGDKTLDDDDTLDVQATFTAADDGV